MAINFPASPSTNDTHTENGITWIFNGTSWDSQGEEVTAASIGLGSVDNTSDLNKPISTAVASALNTLDLDLVSLDAAKISKNVGTTYTTGALASVTQAEYDALTPDSATIYFII